MNPDGTWGDVIRRHREFTHIASPAILEELMTVVDRPRVMRRFGTTGRGPVIRFLLAIVAKAEVVVTAGPSPRICRDEDDDEFFACAVAAHADYIVSEDEDVLAISEYEGVRTIRAAAFLKILDASR